MTDDRTAHHLTRRHLLRLVGMAAGAGLVSSTHTLDALALQSNASGKATFPAGSVIRTILSDLAPSSITGPTLFHEHMSLSTAYWDQMLAGFPANVKERLAVPKGETYFLENLNLITEEMRIAKQDGIGCIVDGGHAAIR